MSGSTETRKEAATVSQGREDEAGAGQHQKVEKSNVKVELFGPTLRVHMGEEGRRGIMGDT